MIRTSAVLKIFILAVAVAAGTILILPPAAGSVAARASFPVLYFAYWFMVALLVGTLAFFIPYSFLTGLRELFHKKKEGKNETDDAH